MLHIDHGRTLLTLFRVRCRQVIRSIVTLHVALLGTDEIGDGIDFLVAYESALNALPLGAGIIDHIAISDEFLRSRRVQNGLGVG